MDRSIVFRDGKAYKKLRIKGEAGFQLVELKMKPLPEGFLNTLRALLTETKQIGVQNVYVIDDVKNPSKPLEPITVENPEGLLVTTEDNQIFRILVEKL